MVKWANDSVLDAPLDKVATGTILTICSQQPTNRIEAVTTYKLASSVIDSSDFTKSDGIVNGRRVTIAAQDQLDVEATANSTHVAICDNTNLLYVTTCTSQTLTLGNKITVPAWNIEFNDPS